MTIFHEYHNTRLGSRRRSKGSSNSFSAISTCSNRVCCYSLILTNNYCPVFTTLDATVYSRQQAVIGRCCISSKEGYAIYFMAQLVSPISLSSIFQLRHSSSTCQERKPVDRIIFHDFPSDYTLIIVSYYLSTVLNLASKQWLILKSKINQS